jgi:flagellar motor switch/type III secretory pathway protein FliN
MASTSDLELQETNVGGARGNRPAGSATAQGPGEGRMEDHPAWPMISRLPVILAVNIPLSGFKVSDLLGLKRGQIIESAWAVTEEVPLKAGAVQLSWGEFDVVDECIALRLTRLA